MRRYRIGDEPVPGYHLVQLLGRGQFGAVWKATSPGGVPKALKIIDLLSGEGIREFTGLQRVRSVAHANLCPPDACWVKTDDGQVLARVPAAPAENGRDATPSQWRELVVVMGLGDQSLFSRLQQCHKQGTQGIPVDELLDYMLDSARGIDHLNSPVHDLGQGPVRIIHGDIKPHNLLLVGGSVQVCDFGLARALAGLRETPLAMGTVAYAAPELMRGRPHHTSDQYCLAVSYFELRTGCLPFAEADPATVANVHRAGKLDLSRLWPAERRVIRKATSVVPEDRWSSCVEMVSALRDAVELARGQRTLGGRSRAARRARRDGDFTPQPQALAVADYDSTSARGDVDCRRTHVLAPSSQWPTARSETRRRPR